MLQTDYGAPACVGPGKYDSFSDLLQKPWRNTYGYSVTVRSHILRVSEGLSLSYAASGAQKRADLTSISVCVFGIGFTRQRAGVGGRARTDLDCPGAVSMRK